MFPDDYFADCYAELPEGSPDGPGAHLGDGDAPPGLRRAVGSRGHRPPRASTCAGRRQQAWRSAPRPSTRRCSSARATASGRLSRPRRLFEDTKVVAKATGALGQRARVLDSTPIFDAVATEDTVTQLRAVIRKLLAALDQAADPLAAEVRAALVRDDEYATPGKPPCDWDDRSAREALVDALVRDANAALDVIGDHELEGATKAAAELLALVAGQDVAEDDDGVFRIVRGVAKDRVISTVDTEARHGHKSKNRHFDGYKAHISIDPDSELIAEVVATPANTHDAKAVPELLAGEPARGQADDPRRLRLCRRSDAKEPRTRGLHPHGEVPTDPQRDRWVHQGPLRRRPRGSHRHLPGRTGRHDHPAR